MCLPGMSGPARIKMRYSKLNVFTYLKFACFVDPRHGPPAMACFIVIIVQDLWTMEYIII